MSKKGFGKFLTGAAIGAGLGILFAPKKGSETREDLKNKAQDIMEDMKNIDAKEIKEKLNAKVQELKKDLENLDKETAKEQIKAKGEALMKKAEELITIAKEKSAPVVEKAAKEIKEKTIIILESALDKLEGDKAITPTENKMKNKTTKSTKTTKPKTV